MIRIKLIESEERSDEDIMEELSSMDGEELLQNYNYLYRKVGINPFSADRPSEWLQRLYKLVKKEMITRLV